ncbi:MAG: hypothetical protein U0414_43330 [Polyangiaceae bacterium]
MSTSNDARALAWARSRFDRHVAGKAPGGIDLALLEELVAHLRALGAPELPEREKLLAEVRRAQHPATASEKLWWGHVANQQFRVHDYQLGRMRRPFEALPVAVYARLIRRLGEILTIMQALPKSAAMDQCIGAVERNIAKYRDELADLERLRAALDTEGVRAALAAACREIESGWTLLMTAHPSLVEMPEVNGYLDRLFDCIVQLDALGPSSEAERAHALGDAWLRACADVLAAQTFPQDTALPTAETRPIELAPHTTVDRRRALRTLLGKPVDEGDTVPGLRMKRGGELVLLPDAIAVFATVGPRNVRSHFAERHLFRWLAFRDKTWDYHQDLRSERDRVGGPRPVHLFVRGAGDEAYFYAGVASVVATRDITPKPGVWIDLALERPITLARWTRYASFRRVVTVRGLDYGFPLDPGRFARWVVSATGLPHFDLVSQSGAKLTLHGGGPRVELVYRSSHDAAPLHSVDETLPRGDTTRVDIVCPCGRSRELRAVDTIPRETAIEALTAFMEGDAIPPSLGVRPPLDPTSNAWLERYRAGDHVAVWDEIRALGAEIRGEAHLPRAMEVLREMMLRVRGNIDLIVTRLRELNYKFEAPDKVRVPPTDSARAALASPPDGVPLCLTAFLGVVGAVNLVQSQAQCTHDDVHHRAGSLGVLGQEGPLELEAAPVTVHEPESWPIFREDCLKADFSGDYVYIELPTSGADVKILSGDIPTEWFVDYLRATIAQGGFRGHSCGDHAHADAKGYGRVPRAFADFLSRDLEPF